MPAAQRNFGSFDDLNRRELEVLRLLASGHTAKTIAVQLDCSEGAVNERLRDARRKTGVGSSRELARLVAAQKNWDDFPELPAQSSAEDSAPQPAPGLNRSKGALIMLFAIPLAAAALAFVVAPSRPGGTAPQSAQAASASPLEGIWSLDVSRIPEAERPRAVTIAFRATGERRWITGVEIVAADGTVRQMHSVATIDGSPVPITGNLDIADTVALRQPGPDALVMTLAKAGAPVSTRMYVVSKDRKTLTETIVWPGEGVPKLETTTFTRKG